MNRFLSATAVLLIGLTTACHHAHQVRHYQRIVILGNSITRHKPMPDIGWTHDWGMAATARDSDFVHILTRRFQQETPGAQVRFQNIAEWEGNYWKYDLTRLDTIKQFNPDLVILRIGENVKGDSIQQRGFAQQFPRLLTRVTTKNTHVVVVGSFWEGNLSTPAMVQMCERQHSPFVALSYLGNDPADRAIGQYKNGGVANHPSNKGMRDIADAIWNDL